jgi:HlyD family secretion protein
MDQMRAQIAALDLQIAAETELLNRTVSGAQAELSLSERSYQERLLTTAADVREARASVDFAREELSRLRTLASRGLISELQLKEKEANLEAAEARLDRVEAALNPGTARIEMAEEKIVQERARGAALLARSRKERELLLQRQVEIQARLDTDREELRQMATEIENTVIRAPISGVIQELELRNRGQVVRSGDLVARIAPGSTSLEIKAFVALRDIGKVELGQNVQMRVSACPFTDFGTLRGSVVAISPDAIPAQEASATRRRGFRGRGASSGYEVTIRPETLTLEASGRTCAIQTGMEGPAQIISREETVLRFVLRKARLATDF